MMSSCEGCVVRDKGCKRKHTAYEKAHVHKVWGKRLQRSSLVAKLSLCEAELRHEDVSSCHSHSNRCRCIYMPPGLLHHDGKRTYLCLPTALLHADGMWMNQSTVVVALRNHMSTKIPERSMGKPLTSCVKKYADSETILLCILNRCMYSRLEAS